MSLSYRQYSSSFLVPLAFLVLFASSSCGDPSSVEADTRSIARGVHGTYMGGVENDVRVWRGIPYAKPPVDDLRWKAARSLERTTNPIEALQFAQPCAQLGSALSGLPSWQSGKTGELVGSEDCLYLNVMSPRKLPSNARLPVLFWIHGGGNVVGGSAGYDFTSFVTRNDAVVVTVQHRLGPLGFMAHPRLTEMSLDSDDARDITANFALTDLVVALQWVQDNITAFNGDPSRVAIVGESAGAVNVLALLTAPAIQNRKLFHAAIAQSGLLSDTPREQASISKEYGGGLNNASDIAAKLYGLAQMTSDQQRPMARYTALAQLLEMSPQGSVDFLKSVPVTDLLKAYVIEDEETGFVRSEVPTIIRDGTMVHHEGLLTAMVRGFGSDIPLIVGTNKNETRLFNAFDERLVNSFLWYRSIKNPLNYELLSDYTSKAWRVLGADQIAAVRPPGSTYLYQFLWDDLPSNFFIDGPKLLGAAHAFEIPFMTGAMSESSLAYLLFNTDNLESAQKLSDHMMDYWYTFASKGTPSDRNSQTLTHPQWVPFYSYEQATTDDNARYITFDTRAGDVNIEIENGRLTSADVFLEIADEPEFSSENWRCYVAQQTAQFFGDFPQKRIRESTVLNICRLAQQR